jgi:hypothetical protein
MLFSCSDYIQILKAGTGYNANRAAQKAARISPHPVKTVLITYNSEIDG